MMDKQSEELKPCPFCGGDGEPIKGPLPGKWGVSCDDCGCWLDERLGTEDEAIAAWNRRALPAVQVTVKPLVWECFDAWTHWARMERGSYYVEERNGRWRLGWRVNDQSFPLMHADDIMPESLDEAKAAAQADYAARIRAALDVDPVTLADPEADDDWCAGNQYALDRLCVVVGADPDTVAWDGSDGSLNEEADALIWRILEAGKKQPTMAEAARVPEIAALIYAAECVDHDNLHGNGLEGLRANRVRFSAALRAIAEGTK